jgi:hypothetical protein
MSLVRTMLSHISLRLNNTAKCVLYYLSKATHYMSKSNSIISKIEYIEKKLNRFELFKLDIITNLRNINRLESIIEKQQEVIEQLDFIVFDLCKRLDEIQKVCNKNETPVLNLEKINSRRLIPDRACKRLRNS